MARGKRSFFERLTGAMNVEEYDDAFEDETPARRPQQEARHIPGSAMRHETPAPEGESLPTRSSWAEEEPQEGQLTVDVFQTPEEIVIRAHVAGVKPEDLDISITRDMVTIKGKREDAREVTDDNYFYRELYWGAFSRTILLPQEIEVEAAQASEKHGLLTLRLPKIDKERQTKLKVKSS